MPETRIRLITQGDDCGSSHWANLAIMEAYRHGILRNTTVMAPCPAVKEAAALFAGERDLCCGLHLTLNAEWDSVRWGPVLPPGQVPTLVDGNGRFLQTTRELHANRPDLGQILAEMQAQLDYARALGFDIKFADTHMGFTWVAQGLDEAIEEWCRRNGLINARRALESHLRVTVDEGDPVERLLAVLAGLAPGQYSLVGHPAYDNEGMRALGHAGYPGEKVAKGRDWERRFFTDQRVLEYCRAHDITPIRHDEAEWPD